MSIARTPDKLSGEGTGRPLTRLWALFESPDHAAGINVWVQTPNGNIYEAQFATEEILDLLSDQLQVSVVNNVELAAIEDGRTEVGLRIRASQRLYGRPDAPIGPRGLATQRRLEASL